MRTTIGVVEDSDEDFAALRRIVARLTADIELERWSRAEDLLAEEEAGREAWPELIFVDLSLPGIDGTALVTRLRDRDPTRSLPLFILSGSARPKDVDRAYAAGASLYLPKPLGDGELRAALDLLGAVRRSPRAR